MEMEEHAIRVLGHLPEYTTYSQTKGPSVQVCGQSALLNYWDVCWVFPDNFVFSISWRSTPASFAEYFVIFFFKIFCRSAPETFVEILSTISFSKFSSEPRLRHFWRFPTIFFQDFPQVCACDICGVFSTILFQKIFCRAVPKTFPSFSWQLFFEDFPQVHAWDVRRVLPDNLIFKIFRRSVPEMFVEVFPTILLSRFPQVRVCNVCRIFLVNFFLKIFRRSAPETIVKNFSNFSSKFSAGRAWHISGVSLPTINFQGFL